MEQHDLHIRHQERERCAKVVETMIDIAPPSYATEEALDAAVDMGQRIAQVIRAMGNEV